MPREWRRTPLNSNAIGASRTAGDLEKTSRPALVAQCLHPRWITKAHLESRSLSNFVVQTVLLVTDIGEGAEGHGSRSRLHPPLAPSVRLL